MSYEFILVEKDGAVGIITLHRPQQLNALSYALVKELSLAMEAFDQDEEIRAIVLTGGEKVFAAGADIKEMVDATPFDERLQGRLAFRTWGTLQGCLGYGGEEVIHIPRGPRPDTPGVLPHVMTRGLERQQIIRDHIVWSGPALPICGLSG